MEMIHELIVNIRSQNLTRSSLISNQNQVQKQKLRRLGGGEMVHSIFSNRIHTTNILMHRRKRSIHFQSSLNSYLPIELTPPPSQIWRLPSLRICMQLKILSEAIFCHFLFPGREHEFLLKMVKYKHCRRATVWGVSIRKYKNICKVVKDKIKGLNT